jgi:hypothetical protein
MSKVPDMKVTGRRISNMEMDWKPGLKALSMKDNMF